MPFHRDSDIATALAHLQDDAPALPNNLPGDAAALVYGMLAKEPSARPSSGIVVANQAAALATSIPAPPGHAPAITGEPTMPDAAAMPGNTLPGIVERPVDVGADDDAGPATLVGAPVGSTVAAEHVRRRRSPRRLVLLSSVLLVLAAAGLGWMLLGGGADTVTVPNVEGKSLSAAKTKLEAADLVIKVGKVDVANAKAGEVVRQDARARHRSRWRQHGHALGRDRSGTHTGRQARRSDVRRGGGRAHQAGADTISLLCALGRGCGNRDRGRPRHHRQNRRHGDPHGGQRHSGGARRQEG